jgi:hypothetical protein
MAFDIKIVTKDRNYWVNVTDIQKILKNIIVTVPIYAQGTFAQMMDINTKIDSTIPELLGLDKLDKNMIEGLVIRPNETIETKSGRIILKKKNE